MSGVPHVDPGEIELQITLPDGRALYVSGYQDGVNGIEWAASLDGELLDVGIVDLSGDADDEEDDLSSAREDMRTAFLNAQMADLDSAEIADLMSQFRRFTPQEES